MFAYLPVDRRSLQSSQKQMAEKLYSNAWALSLNNATPVKVNIFLFSPVKEHWYSWLSLHTHCFTVGLTTPQAYESQTGRSKEE